MSYVVGLDIDELTADIAVASALVAQSGRNRAPDRLHVHRRRGRASRIISLEADGLPAYTTSAGWLGYDDDKDARLVRKSVADGFTMLKLKVGSDVDSDVRRPKIARTSAGDDARIALDANQR